MTKEMKMTPVSTETRAALAEVMSAFEAFKSANDTRLAEIEKRSSADILLEDKVSRIDQALDQQKSALDRLLLDAQRPVVSGASTTGNPAWQRYVRQGDLNALQEAKSLNAGTPGEGGYVVPRETEHLIDRLLGEVSPVRAIASVRASSSASFRKPVSRGGAASGWVSETAARPETTAPDLDLLDFPAAELYAMPAATQQLLDDAMVDVDQWLAEEIRDVFAAQESAAFIAGDGVNKPRGILSYNKAAEGSQAWGEMGYVATGVDGGFDASDPGDALIDLI